MSYSYNYVTVKGQYTDEFGDATGGTVQWNPSGPIVDHTLHVTISTQTYNLTLDNKTGLFTVSLLAMDNTDFAPNTWCWNFKPQIQNIVESIQPVSVLFSNGATQWIDELPTYTGN